MKRALLAGFVAGAVAALVWPTVSGGREVMLGAYSTSLEGRSEGQLHNIRKAARLLDGCRVLPGEEFSTARALGPTTAARGWVEAQAIVGGKVEQAAAGGICQASSTLYNAALLAGMQVTERHAHSRPIASVPPGRDAAVAAGAADLRFRNMRAWPVTVRASVGSARLVIAIHGRGPKPPPCAIQTEMRPGIGRLDVTTYLSAPGQPRRLIARSSYLVPQSP